MACIIETSSGDHLKVWTKDPYSAQKKYRKKRLAEDPEYKANELKAKREASRQRYAQDPEYRKRCIETSKRAQHRKQTSIHSPSDIPTATSQTSTPAASPSCDREDWKVNRERKFWVCLVYYNLRSLLTFREELKKSLEELYGRYQEDDWEFLKKM